MLLSTHIFSSNIGDFFNRLALPKSRSFLFQGELTITSDMEALENALFLDQVPPIWTARAYPSLLGLTSWFVDLLMRIRELETWSTDFVVRVSVFSLLRPRHDAHN